MPVTEPRDVSEPQGVTELTAVWKEGWRSQELKHCCPSNTSPRLSSIAFTSFVVLLIVPKPGVFISRNNFFGTVRLIFK